VDAGNPGGCGRAAQGISATGLPHAVDSLPGFDRVVTES
jgi:hypothetical protein